MNNKTKHIKLFESFTEECKWLSDDIRVGIIKDTIEAWDKDEDFKEDRKDDPEFDSLLNPDPWYGYDNQTYVQYIDDNTIIFWEGWSSLCWEGAYVKDIYKEKTKKEVLEHIKDIRFPYIAKQSGMTIKSFDYWFEQSWTDLIEDGYIMKIIMTKD